MEGQASSPTLSEMILDRFALKSPLPASLRLAFEQMFEPAAIDAIFEAHREEQYLRQILFSTVVHVMFEVVSRRVASLNAAAQARKDTLGASVTALYDKIRRTEPRIVEQLVAASFRRARDLVSAMGGLRDAPCRATAFASSTATTLRLPSVASKRSGRSALDPCRASLWWPSTMPR